MSPLTGGKMRTEKRVSDQVSVVFLLCISALFLLSSCSKQSGNDKQEPQSLKVDGQSGNWKVTLGSIKKTPKQPTDRRPEAQYDLLDIELDLEFVGPSGNVPAPNVALIDNKGQKSQAIVLALEGTRNSPTTEKEMEMLLLCFSPSQTETCSLKTGNKAAIRYSFKDPKDYANLMLAFGDVPPIPLKVP
jgi:hypothetical protein